MSYAYYFFPLSRQVKHWSQAAFLTYYDCCCHFCSVVCAAVVMCIFYFSQWVGMYLINTLFPWLKWLIFQIQNIIFARVFSTLKLSCSLIESWSEFHVVGLRFLQTQPQNPRICGWVFNSRMFWCLPLYIQK